MIPIKSELITTLFNFPVTNTIIHTLIVDLIIIISIIIINKNLKIIPGFFQSIVESGVESFYSLTESVAGVKAKKIFPYVMTFFIFILISNWTALLPGFGTIGIFHEKNHHVELIPILRATTSDLNTTLALALVSAVATHALSINILGIKEYASRFFSLNPIYLFVGLLEIVSEITKVVSLSFRLFGNIFAGEVVLITISTLFAFVFPIPFIMLEIIVGLVQALVFAMLTMAFMAILTTSHEGEQKLPTH